MAATPSQPLFIHQKLPLDEQAPPDYNDDAENNVDTNEQYDGKGRLREKNPQRFGLLPNEGAGGLQRR